MLCLLFLKLEQSHTAIAFDTEGSRWNCSAGLLFGTLHRSLRRLDLRLLHIFVQIRQLSEEVDCSRSITRYFLPWGKWIR